MSQACSAESCRAGTICVKRYPLASNLSATAARWGGLPGAVISTRSPTRVCQIRVQAASHRALNLISSPAPARVRQPAGVRASRPQAMLCGSPPSQACPRQPGGGTDTVVASPGDTSPPFSQTIPTARATAVPTTRAVTRRAVRPTLGDSPDAPRDALEFVTVHCCEEKPYHEGEAYLKMPFDVQKRLATRSGSRASRTRAAPDGRHALPNRGPPAGQAGRRRRLRPPAPAPARVRGAPGRRFEGPSPARRQAGRRSPGQSRSVHPMKLNRT